MPEPSFLEQLLGRPFLEHPLARRFLALPANVRLAGAIAVFGALLYLPYLGAVGLWDCWETHYGEVAREMVARNDYVVPYWEAHWFFSKPVLTLWMMALGMQVAGTERNGDELSHLTEWGMRLPFALLSILALVLLGLAVARTVSRRAGLATAFVLGTMPLYFLLSRQAVTDTPVVATMSCAVACALIAQLDLHTRHRAGWWYGFYAFCGLGVLAKGLLGLIPAVVLLLYAALCVIPWDEASLRAHARWLRREGRPALIALAVPVLGFALFAGVTLARASGLGAVKPLFAGAVAAIGACAALCVLVDRLYLRRTLAGPPPAFWQQLYDMRLGTGVLLLFAIAVPWYLQLSLFPGLDDERRTFFDRFFLYDHFSRLAAGVYTSTPGGTFIYFVEQGAYALFPWVALVPGALSLLGRTRLRGGEPADHVAAIALVWTAFSFALVGMSATKFHHYVFPALPGLAVLIGLFVDRLWTQGVARHAPSLLVGGVFFLLVGTDLARNPKLFTDLFVFNYDRPYPVELVTQPLRLLAFPTARWAELLGVALLLFAALPLLLAWGGGARGALARPLALGATFGCVALALVCATQRVALPALQLGLALLLVAGALARESRGLGAAAATALAAVAGGWLLYRWGLAGRFLETLTVQRLLGGAFALAGGLALVALAARSRELLFGGFGALALGLALWFGWSHWVDLSHHWTQRDLFWRYHALRREGEPIAAFLMNWRGETLYSRNTVKQVPADNAEGRIRAFAAQPGREWALVEHNRLGVLKAALGPGKTVTTVDRDATNKFALVTIE